MGDQKKPEKNEHKHHKPNSSGCCQPCGHDKNKDQQQHHSHKKPHQGK